MNSQLAYQEAAVRNAGPVDLVIVMYDVLARDLQKAIAAMQAHEVELRSKHIKHGFLVLQQLEGTLNMEEGGVVATTMARFYAMVRSQMMKAQVQQDPSVLHELIQLIFSVREAWVEAKTKIHALDAQPAHQVQNSPYDQTEAHSASWNT